MLVRPVLWLSLLAAPLAHAADSALLDLLPPNATLVIGVNVRNLAGSALVQRAMAEAKTAGPQWTAMFQLIGFDPMRDLDEVMLAVTGTGKNPPGLVLARGRFASLRASLSRQKGSRANQFTFLDDNTAIGGDAPAVQAALKRRGATAAQGNALAVRVAAAAERYDLFGLGTIPAIPEAMPGPAGQFASLVDRFQFGMSVSHGLQMAAELEAKTPEGAQALSALISAALQSQKEAADISRHLNLTTEGRALRISITIPEAEMEKLMQAGAKSMAARSALAQARPAPGTPVVFGDNTPPRPVEKSRVPPGAVLMITGSESDGGTIVVKKP